MMDKNKFIGLFVSKLFRKFLIWFLLIALIPIGYLSFFSIQRTKQIIENEGRANLIYIAEQRMKQIDDFFEERKRDIDAQKQNPFIMDAVENLAEIFKSHGIKSVAYQTEDTRVSSYLSTIRANLDLYDILFISPDGDVVYTEAKESDWGTNLLTDAFVDTELEKAFKASLAKRTTEISYFKIYEPSNQPTFFISAPVQRDDLLLGIMVFQLDPKLVNELAANYIGLGDTGEMVLASLVGDEAVVNVPLRHNPEAAFNMKIKMGSDEGLPIQDAVNGGEGEGVSVDYRGNEILSVWRYLPSFEWGIVLKINTDEVFGPAKGFLNRTLLISSMTVIFVLIFSVLVSRSIVNPVIRIKESLESVAEGEFPDKIELRSRDEIGEINVNMGKVIDSFKGVVGQANVIASGDYHADINLRSEKDELGMALQKMTGSLRTSSEENDRNDWLKSGQSELDDQLRGEQNIEPLCKSIVSFVSKYINAEIGTLYINSGNGTFKLKASYAYKARKNLSNEFKLGEGIVGQAALEKQSILLKNVPEDYISVTSGLGEKKPNNILVTPFIFNDEVVGLLEVGSFSELTELHLQFLENISEGIAIAINSTLARDQLAQTLEKSQTLSEELQNQQEELETTNEELKNQTEALQKSEELLKSQQEELQVSNEELEEKSHFLEDQKDEITKKNDELESSQNRLRTKAEELEVTSRYKSDFLSNMSHELRTPLNSVLILSQQLAQNKSKKLDTKQVEAAEIINSSGNDLLNLINEILDLSKIESGKMTLNIEKIPLKEVADSIRSSFNALIEKKGLKLEVDLDPDLVKKIQTDRQRLEQIIKNFMSNALKFTENGKITLRFSRPPKNTDLSRSGLDSKNSICISVMDTGIGIPEEKQLQIFEAFQQVDGSTSRKYGGTGLGLSISRELVKLLGGEIQLNSSVREGSTFALYVPEVFAAKKGSDRDPETKLPLSVDHSQKIEKKKEIKNRSMEKAQSSPTIDDDRANLKEGDKIILVIEDDLNFAKTLYDFCHEKNFKCIHAGDGETGLEYAVKHKVDAVILDIVLPGIEGWGVLEALKDNPKTRHIPVHIMSIDEESIDAMKKGAIGYLTKPVTQKQLDHAFTKIEKLLSKKLKDLLIVEDDETVKNNIAKLIGNGDIKIKTVDKGESAIFEIERKRYDCVILDFRLPDMSGFEILKRLDENRDLVLPPIIVYTAQDITREEEYELQKYVSTIILKDVRSEERLFDEAALFLHRVVEDLPVQKKKIISKLHDKEMAFEGKKVLLVDDDMRNIFAISQVLEEKGIEILKAANGKMALDILAKEKNIDLVLMDIMMPVMDGYEAMKKVREQKRFWKLPILALTAKAMKDDRDKCIAAGANDYLPKPVDISRLLSLMRVWLYK